MKDLVDRQAAMDAFGLSEKTRKYGGDHSGYRTMMLYEIQDTLEDLPSVQPEPYRPERKAATQLTNVDAIPVEWIRKQIDAEPKWSEKGMYYAELLMDWAEREKEC